MDRPVRLTTERLLLRLFTMDDVGDVLEYSKDPEWARYQKNIPPHPFSRKDASALVAMFSAPSNWESHQTFAIVFGGKVIGEITLNQRVEDRNNKRSELVYSLSRQHWGKGLMTEAGQAVVNWAFQTYSFNRMFTTCDPRNVGSCRVLEKLGMSREGLLRNHVIWQGEVRDVMYYGILRAGWKA